MEVDKLALELLLQTGGEGALPLIKGNYKWTFPLEWKNVVPESFSKDFNLQDLHKRIQNAVSSSTRTAEGKRIAVLLSGGVDSTSLLRYTTYYNPDADVMAYHTDWHYPPRSEVEHAQHAADFCGVELKKIDVSPVKQVPFVEEALIKTKTIDYSITPVYMVFKQMKADGIDVAFNALGIDEYLSGYPIHRRLYDRMDSKLPKILPPMNASSRPMRLAMRKFGDDKTFFLFNSMINPNMRFGNTPAQDVKQMIENFYSDVKRGSLWNTIQMSLAKGMYHNYATNITRAAQAAGMKVNFPYFDYDLANFCFGIRPDLKVNKKPFREIMKVDLGIPESLYMRGANWYAGKDWDKYAWGGTIEPYLESPEYMSSIRPKEPDVNLWFSQKAIKKFWSLDFKRPSRVLFQMHLFLKLMDLIK